MLPVPYDPKLSSPGRLRPNAISSPTFLAGEACGTISSNGDDDSSTTGTKSRIRSVGAAGADEQRVTVRACLRYGSCS